MSKIIPVFYIPKEYPEDMKILAEGLVANNGQTLKATLSWLEGKLVTHKPHKGKPAGIPMSATTIQNYLEGFYVLDFYKADGQLYSETQTEKTRASISVQSKIQAVTPLENLVKHSDNLERFTENLTEIGCQYSQLVKDYNKALSILDEQEWLPENPTPAKLQELLVQHCGYSFVGQPGVGYLDRFYRDKISIDSYLNLLDFIVKNYGDQAQKSLGLVPLAQIFTYIKQVSDYTEDEFKKHLIQLQLTHRIELRTTKSQFARNIGIDLVDIRGVNYGFIKILEPAIAV
ncbi:hypothetical protein [Oscillatoria acuminata]|uniref:Uncharacterized protein n=1 Tax=Oscillatoria acuminata PCC 6304 TaxID=56110 RepID=K9TPN7_9CYAN|nr:hypothetical protein [Oscillatoria acuminata]AFY83979.1 hypothetical protein Oscil6304_4461 [Oscillatoria acuminata PCC 6304]